MIRVLIVGRGRLHREVLAEVLGHRPRVDIVGTVALDDDRLPIVLALKPDVVLVDGSTPDAAPIVSLIVDTAPEVRIIAYGIPETPSDILLFAEAGIHGYLADTGTVDELLITIEQVQRGELSCPPKVAGLLLQRVSQLASQAGSLATDPSRLTRRESEVMELVDQGLTNKDIARRLGIEVSTAKNHVHNILEKLQVTHRGEAAARIRARRPRWTPAGGRRDQAS